MNTICRVDNQVSIVMRPAASEVWVTPGPAAGKRVDQFFSVAVPEPAKRGFDVEPGPPRPAGKTASLPRIASRFVMRMSPKAQPPHASDRPVLNGAALLVGDNPAVDALRTELTRLGTRCFVLTSGDDPASRGGA